MGSEMCIRDRFKTIARQVLEDGGEDPDRGAGYIDTKKIDEDKSEIS